MLIIYSIVMNLSNSLSFLTFVIRCFYFLFRLDSSIAWMYVSYLISTIPSLFNIWYSYLWLFSRTGLFFFLFFCSCPSINLPRGSTHQTFLFYSVVIVWQINYLFFPLGVANLFIWYDEKVFFHPQQEKTRAKAS